MNNIQNTINIKYYTKVLCYAILFSFDILILTISFSCLLNGDDIYAWIMFFIGIIQVLLIIKNVNFNSENFDNILLDIFLPSVLANYWLIKALLIEFSLNMQPLSILNKNIFSVGEPINSVISIICVLLNIFSLFCAIYLGKCFVVFAEANGLVKTGIYKFTRNPIYLGYFCANILSLVVNFSVINTCIVLIFCYFFSIRIKREEYNLEKHFGEDFIKYKDSVPALIPFLIRR